MDKIKIFRQKNMIFSLFIFVIGLLLLAVNYTYIRNVGSILIVSGIYSIIDSYYLKNSMIDMVIEKIKLEKDINDTGLIETGNNLADINYKNYFKNVNSNIDILHVYARTWTNNNYDFIKNAVMNKECRLRVILLNPESLFVQALEGHYGYQKGELVKIIREVEEIWKKLNKEVEAKRIYFANKKNNKNRKNIYDNDKYGSVELYFYNGQPSNSIYCIDNELIVVNTKTSKEKSIHLPYSIYRNNDRNGLYKMYLDEIENIIRDAKKIDLL